MKDPTDENFFAEHVAARRAGRQAAANGVPRDSNPYFYDWHLAAEWQASYDQVVRDRQMEQRMRRLHEEYGEDW